jgi:gas vesicle protein
MRNYDDDGVPYVVIERSGSGMAPFVWGALLGAAAALLLAPKSGAETQEELKERARRLRQRAEDKAHEFQEGLQEAWSEGRRQVEAKLDDARKTVSEGRSRAQQAWEAGREAARSARTEYKSELERAGQSEESPVEG